MPNPHDYRLLEQEIGCQCEHLPPVKRVVSFVFAHHIYGFLFSILLPKALQCPVLSLPPFPSKKAISSLRPGDLVLGFPLFWDRFLATGQGVPDQVYGVTSTAPCPKESIMGLLDLGFCSIVEVYGSSETGGIGVRQDPGQPYTLLSCWERPTSDQQSALWRVDPEPRAWQFFALPDRLIWYGPRTFLPQGRKDKAVQVAGHNVYPERVRQCILTQPMVQDCLVRLMRQEEGDRLKAFIVLKDPSVDQVEARREIVRWMSQGLSSAETPGKISFGQRLPRNSMGKLSDW
jgi:4-coumarate--CoA ligase (photoactive yellow protein activation family)